MAAESETGGFNIHPMDQFLVRPLFGGTETGIFTPTNVTLWMGLTVLVIIGLMVLAPRRRRLVPGRMQSIAEVLYSFVHKMVEDIAGREGLRYFPYILTIFLFVLVANVLGLLPMSFTTTSHIAVTATMALVIFFTVTILGFVKNGMQFLGLFWISSAPLALRPVLAIIEVISYFVRPVSHSIRLAGNMMAGHAVIKVFAGFAGVLGIGSVAPVVAIMAVYGLESLVVCIQAYVFTILTSLNTTRSDRSHFNSEGAIKMAVEGNLVEMGALVGAGLACTGMGGAAVGVGHVVGNYLSGALRNPAAAGGQTATMFIGIAFAEALGIFSFLVALLLMYAQ